MKKNLRKLMALMLALSMCASLMTMPAFAADGTETVDNGDGTTTTTTTTTTTEDGKTVVTVEFETKDEEGNLVASGGSEEKEIWTKEDTGGKPGQPEVTVPLEPGETTSASATDSIKFGDVPSGEDDKDYNYIEFTETERTVTAETSEVEVKVDYNNTGVVDMEGMAPVYDVIEGKKEDKGGMFDYQFNDGATSKYAKNPESWNMPEGADVRYVGTGEHSKYYVATAYVEYEKDDAGNTIYDENGNPVIKEIRRYSDETSAVITIDGVPVTELPDGTTLEPIYDNYGGSRPFIFMLMDQQGNKYYAYCCDLETGTADGEWYSVSNLEDSNYYASEDSEKHIRSIVMNGYWGTTDIQKEDGSYETGSLELLKQKLKDAIEADPSLNTTLTAPVLDPNNKYMPVVDENGEVVTTTKTMLEMVEGLTAGEALLATQAAVWTYANGSNNVLNGNDGSIVVDPDGYKWNHDAMGNSKNAGGMQNGEAMDDFASAAVDFLYNWLIGLETEEESSVVINEKNFVEDLSLSIGDLVANAAQNQDDDQDNNVYNAGLNFKLAFVPGENDDLLVQISYTDLDGKSVNVTKRLAGENGEDQTYETIVAEGGVYTIEGLKLSENEDFAFDLRLEGTQYLEQGAYVYAPVGGRDVSQTFVGIAEGYRDVDVSMGVTIKFDVDENNKLTAKRAWSQTFKTTDPVDPPEEEIEIPEETPPLDPVPPVDEPEIDIPEEEPPLVDIPEEEPPLTDIPEEDPPVVDIPDKEIALEDVPKTGDVSLLALGLTSLLSGGGLVGLVGMGRKGKEND